MIHTPPSGWSSRIGKANVTITNEDKPSKIGDDGKKIRHDPGKRSDDGKRSGNGDGRNTNGRPKGR